MYAYQLESLSGDDQRRYDELRNRPEYYEPSKAKPNEEALEYLHIRRRYYKKHAEKLREKSRNYYFNNKSKRQEYHNKYYQDNKDKFAERRRNRYLKKKELERQKNLEHYHQNREAILARRKELQALKRLEGNQKCKCD